MRIVLTAAGTAAWIRDRVYRLDASGVTVLDDAAEYGSLAVAARRAYWMRDGQPRTALLDDVTPRRAADPRASRSRDCRVRGRTITANARVRVFARVDGSVSRVYYACDLARHRTRLIGRWDRGEGGVGPHFALAGRRVAYEELHCDGGSDCAGFVAALDATTGRVWAEQIGGVDVASDLVIADDRAVAWIRPGAAGPAVTTAGPPAAPMLRDAGPGVEAGSLTRAGNPFYWMRDGVPQTAASR